MKFFWLFPPLMLLFGCFLRAQSPGPVEGSYIVTLRSPLEKSALRNVFAGSKWRTLTHNDQGLVSMVLDNVNDEQLAAIRKHPTIIDIRPDYYLEKRSLPNDPDLPLQWGIEAIGVDRVWEWTTGGLTDQGDTIVIAVLDDGFDLEHEDLRDNIWRNLDEVPNDGRDNDNNGYIDDIRGWNFISQSPDHPPVNHGTSVIGLLGASGDNGRGGSGINWRVKIMPLTVQRVSEIIEAYEYAREQRARYNASGGQQGAFVVVTNASLGISRTFCEEFPTWGAQYDALGEVGVLSVGATDNRPYDVDMEGDMPTSCPSAFLLTVLNLTQSQRKASDSAFGRESIDMGAPGDDSWTTKSNNRYGSFGDNSAAAPHLAGSIALLYGLPCASISIDALSNPQQTAEKIRDAILTGVLVNPELEPYTVTGGQLNTFRAMEIIQETCNGSTGELKLLEMNPNPATTRVQIRYETPDFGPYDLFITNMLGQVVYQTSIAPPRFSEKIIDVDLPALPPGIYMISLRKGKDVQSARLVIGGN